MVPKLRLLFTGEGWSALHYSNNFDFVTFYFALGLFFFRTFFVAPTLQLTLATLLHRAVPPKRDAPEPIPAAAACGDFAAGPWPDRPTAEAARQAGQQGHDGGHPLSE